MSSQTDEIPYLSPEDRLKQYKAGSIVRIKLTNFLTYANVEFKPGPRLNVVIGPNGTGKSTILCAICLGLGGQPPLLGRADDARLFIKHDEQCAEVEIELAPHPSSSNQSRRDVLRRVIDRNKGAENGRGVAASSYYINGKLSNLKSVQQLVSEKYHIAIENLCTFLPQDKVGSFSGFEAQDLLRETEKSVASDERLYDIHQELIELEKEILDSDTNLQTIQDKEKTLQSEVDQLEKMKELMEEREMYLKQLKLLEQKHAWVLFDNKREEALRLKAKKQELKGQLRKAREQIVPIMEKMEVITEELDRNTQRKAELNKSIKTSHQKYDNNLVKHQKFIDEIENCMVELTEIDSRHRRAALRVEECKKKYEQQQAILSTFPPEQEMVDAYRTAQDEQKVIRNKMRELKNSLTKQQQAFREKKEELNRTRNDFDRMKDEKARRNEKIFQSDDALRRAFEWINSNRKMFRREVWGPVVCEITTDDVDISNCLEQHVRNNVWNSFVVECMSDYDLLYREVREKCKIPINIQVVENGKLNPINRKYSDNKMALLKREDGIQGYLDECFTAPDPILQALRNTSNVQSVVMGNQTTTDSLNNRNLMDLLNQKENGQGLQASCVFATDRNKTYKYTSVISRYSGKASLSVDEISKAKMLKPGVPPEQKAQAENQIRVLESELDDITPQMQDLQQQYDSLQKQGQEIQNRMTDARKGREELQEVKNRLAVYKRKLRDAESEVSKDSEEEKRQTKSSLRLAVKKCVSTLEAASENYDKFLSSSTELTGIEFAEEGKRQTLSNLVDQKAEAENSSRALEQSFREVSDTFNREKAALCELNERAMAIAPLKDQDGNDLPLKAELDELPDDATELEGAMDDTKERINSIHENPDVMKRYEKQKEELLEVKEQLRDMKDSKQKKRQILQSKREPWEAALDVIVGRVSGLFGHYMKELGCAGDVRLAKGNVPTRGRGSSNNDTGEENLGNFKEWGIQIRVKFREASDLQVLSAQVHSGGERSVSTIMYLMAMQNMMVSPFRCVDEINQGLDERNERLVFKRIVENSTKAPEEQDDPTSHCGQYFLITPKLLPNLTDMENENVTVHCIFNGPYNFKNFNDWDAHKFLNAKRRLARHQSSRDGKENTPEDYSHRKKQKTGDF